MQLLPVPSKRPVSNLNFDDGEKKLLLCPTPSPSSRRSWARNAEANLLLKDPRRNQYLRPSEVLVHTSDPSKQFDKRGLKEVRDVGSLDMPLTMCTKTAQTFRYTGGTSHWSTTEEVGFPEHWRVNEGVWMPKGEVSSKLEQFHIIYLLSTESSSA